MQIQNAQVVQSPTTLQPINSNAAPSDSVSNSAAATETGVQVSISSAAQQLASADKVSTQDAEIQPMPPTEPKSPLSGEQLDKAVQIKKAQVHYNVTSEMANIVNGNSNDNDGLSVAGAYYLSQNEDAREVALNAKSQQQNMQTMLDYQEQTAALNEQYS